MEPLRLLGSLPSFGDLQSGAGEPPAFGDSHVESLPFPTPEVRLHSFLSPEDETQLAGELCQMLDGYDSAMARRWEREKLIDDCYNLVPNAEWGGGYEDAAELVSEKLMSAVDQEHARVTGQLLAVAPLVAFEGVESQIPDADSARIAKVLETWEDRYLRHELKIETFLSDAIYPVSKFGTSIVRVAWSDDKQAVERTLIQNHDAVLWPAWSRDWQEAEWAGHKSLLTISGFRRLCASLSVPDPLRDQVELSKDSKTSDGVGTFADLKSSGVDVASVTGVEKYGLVEVYELWGNRILPGDEFASKFVVLFHRESKTILHTRLNDQRSGRHPYHPLRRKIPGATAWGQGVGHEVLSAQAQDTFYMNLETDTLKASCFGIYIKKSGSVMSSLFDRPAPGLSVEADDPEGDFRHVSLANAEPLQMLNMARQNNEQRAISATGQAAVLSGQGDPTMKSGAGTGAVMQLITEAGKKFGQIDRNIRHDFADLCLHVLELCAQYGQGKAFVDYLSPEESEIIVGFLTSLPPTRPLDKLLRVSLLAPSASNNEEVRKSEMLVVYNMAQAQAQSAIQMAVPILQQTNPAAIIPFMIQWSDLLSVLGQDVLDSHEVMGVKDKVPMVSQFMSPTPEQDQINVLMGQMQQMQQVLMASSQAPPPGTGSRPGGGTRSGSSTGGGATS